MMIRDDRLEAPSFKQVSFTLIVFDTVLKGYERMCDSTSTLVLFATMIRSFEV